MEDVISSIRRIKQLCKDKCQNRLIITTRPIDDGLKEHLEDYNPKSDGKHNYFLSLYGFTKEHFNRWLYSEVSKEEVNLSKLNGFAKEIANKILAKEDIYNFFVENDYLQESELQRPIFAYMIYKLILNNIDFSQVGKIGIYISFLNILTTDAKHINEPNLKIKLSDEFRFRNILHFTSALWMKLRESEESIELKRVDIFRAIRGENLSDREISEKYKDSDLADLEFFSHSYFGQDGDTLYFNHQSFAEILLAEYYLRIFIKYALDGKNDKDLLTARVKLTLGNPTNQTIEFLKQLIRLLKESVGEATKERVQKRDMLFQYIASICINDKDNELQCTKLYNRWYEDYENEFKNDGCDYPKEMIEKWAIDETVIEKIVTFTKEILEDETDLAFAKVESKSSLYDSEVAVFKDRNRVPDMDKWLALLIGNELYTDIEKEQFFTRKIENFENLFQLIRNWNYFKKEASPEWGQNFFIGVSTKNNKKEIDMSQLDLSAINFSYSILDNINFSYSYIFCRFDKSILKNSRFWNTELEISNFSNIIEITNNNFYNIHIHGGINLPDELIRKLNNKLFMDSNLKKQTITDIYGFGFIIATLQSFYYYGLKNNLLDTEFLKTLFKFENNETKSKYFDMIDELKEKLEKEKNTNPLKEIK